MVAEIDEEQIFKQIKKQNGEKFAQVIRGDRDHGGSLLGIPNIVHILEFAGHDENDARQIRNVLREKYLADKSSELKYYTTKDPLELLDEAGYEAWYVNNVEEQNAIAGYFRSPKAAAHNMTGGHPRSNGNHGGLSSDPTDNGELLCTVYNNLDHGDKRFDNFFVIHAVKKEALGDDKLAEEDWHIKPSDNPQREDEYGTSVISIQIPKDGGSISIKNRYNHTLRGVNPDNTFDNNPDNIIPGLSYALKRHFGVDFVTTDTPLPNGSDWVHDQIVHYNYEIDNIRFGPDYYFSGSNITRLVPDHQIMMDYMILDTKTKEVSSEIKEDTALGIFKVAFNGKNIKIAKDKANKTTTITTSDGNSVTVKDGKIIELVLPGIKEIGKNFLWHNKSLQSVSLPDVEKIDENFMVSNEVLSHFDAPKLQRTEEDFLPNNTALTELNLPELIKIGRYSLGWNHSMKFINLPKAKSVGGLPWDQPNLKYFYAPELRDDQLESFADNNRVAAEAIRKARLEKRFKEAEQRVNQKMSEMFAEADKKLKKIEQDVAERLEQNYQDRLKRFGHKLENPENE